MGVLRAWRVKAIPIVLRCLPTATQFPECFDVDIDIDVDVDVDVDDVMVRLGLVRGKANFSIFNVPNTKRG